MIKKKICLVGEFGVGKTSIASRYVDSHFSEKYLTTIGVSIKQKSVFHNGHEMSLIIWDIAGEQEDAPLNPNYLGGLSGFVVVCDATLNKIFEVSERLVHTVEEIVGKAPHVILVNKIDLISDTKGLELDVARLRNRNHRVCFSSARTGEGVEPAFKDLLDLFDLRESQYG